MDNITNRYTPDEIVNISGKRPSDEMIRGLKVFATALRRYGFDFAMPEKLVAQWAYCRAISSVFADGYIQGKRDERAKRKISQSAA